MSNLENFNNIHANLSESAYSGKARPKNFPPKSNSSKEQFFDFSKDGIIKNSKGDITNFTKGGTNLPNDGIVYLQPDPTIKTSVTPKTYQTPQMNGGYEAVQYDETVTQKGLLTDDKAGFNAYFVTDTPKLSKDTKQTYLAIRGSDAAGIDTLNDWIANDANFAGVVLVLILIIGTIFMIQRRTPFNIFLTKDHTKPTQANQIAYLKKHEQEMTAAMLDDKVKSVQWQWDTVEVGTIGNGTPQGAGTMLTINGKFNDIEDSDFQVGFKLKNDKSYPSLKDITLMQDLSVLKGEVWYNYE